MKNRAVKTLYEKFSHHKVDDLEFFKDFLKLQIEEYVNENVKEIFPNINIFEVLEKLDIMINGTFYVSAESDWDVKTGKGKFYSDAYCFRDIWEHNKIEKPFSSTDNKFMKVQVVMCDHKDACLVVYQNTRTIDGFYNIHIIRDKNSEVLLEGNIAHMMNNKEK